MRSPIETDLSRKLQMNISEVLQREADLASHFLDLTSIGFIMLEATVMTGRTTAATLANSVDTDEGAALVYNTTIDAIIEQLNSSRADGLERTFIARRARQS